MPADRTPAPRRFAKGDDTAFLVSRVGGLEGQAGAPSFSTVQIPYYQKEIEIETEDEKWNRRTKGSCVENVDEIMPAPQAGWLIQDILSDV